MTQLNTQPRVFVVIPAYKVKNEILGVIEKIPSFVEKIVIVDDRCPDDSGTFAQSNSNDLRITLIHHHVNQGVGGAMKSGYAECLRQGADIVVKIDGDGQMEPQIISSFIDPLIAGQADYAKGNRFTDTESIKVMPKFRLFGNLVLSFVTKISTGYWDLFDPNNGYTAITGSQLKRLALGKIDNRYFFESDMLFRLGLNSVRVVDVPMNAKYGSEVSNLSIKKAVIEFPWKHFLNTSKRIMYTYFLRDFSLASIQLLLGSSLMFFGLFLGVINWLSGQASGVPTPIGTLILISMTFLSGLQMLLSFLAFDISRSGTFRVLGFGLKTSLNEK